MDVSVPQLTNVLDSSLVSVQTSHFQTQMKTCAPNNANNNTWGEGSWAPRIVLGTGPMHLQQHTLMSIVIHKLRHDVIFCYEKFHSINKLHFISYSLTQSLTSVTK